MNRHYSKSKLAAAQDDLWLAEIEREDGETLVITLAGPGRIVMIECSGLNSLAIAYESLDPDVLPKDLILEDGFQLSRTTEFESDDEIAARLSEISPEFALDVLSASKHEWLDGDLASLKTSPLLIDLRVESWRLEPQPIDLHLLIGCQRMTLSNEDGEIDVKFLADEKPDAIPGDPAPPYDAPQEPAFDADVRDLPGDMAEAIRAFFEAGIANDFETLAEIIPNFDRDRQEQVHYFAEHFHNLFDWCYGRALESWQVQGPLANVRIRGIIHSRAEDGIQSINEECVWSFSLRKQVAGWVIRNWSTSWPSVGGAAPIPRDQKPWLDHWNSGPVL